jgi:fructose/tagatose bisphosphate aldolase
LLDQECIELGVRKFNVNTEVRNSYLESLKKPEKDLIQVMASAKEAMKAVVIRENTPIWICGESLSVAPK